MTGDRDGVAIFGTTEAVPPPRSVVLGDLSFTLDAEALRGLSWRGVEVVRAISWPMRDPDWVTFQQTVVEESADQDAESFTYRLVFTIGDGALRSVLTIRATSDGRIDAKLAMTATRDFATNRAGFTVLHPIQDVAGEPLTVRHSDGSAEATAFPDTISPGQPALDIVGLAYAVRGVSVDIAFTGDTFEMEDQRNWSDASYKTYCHPLVVPFTYAIKAGETVDQTVAITVSGKPAATGRGATGEAIHVTPGDAPFPEIALALEAGWLGPSEATSLVQAAGIRRLLVRTGPDHDPVFLGAAAEMTRGLGAGVDVEIVVPQAGDPTAALELARAALDSAGLKPERVIALPAGYLDSHQPSGPWPEGATPDDVARAARVVFADAHVGGGMLTNFTEFNRCRPDPATVDYVSHGTAAIVHAADDRSVIETLETLPHIFASAEALAGGKPYRLGLVSLAMRSNPYGAAVAGNADQIRQTMAMDDPRQRGLFAAAWAVGALAATAGSAVEALAPAAPGGPFGIVSDGADTPRPLYDEASDAVVYPLYHVIRAAAELAGKPRFTVMGLPVSVHGFAAEHDGGVRLVLANVGSDAATVTLPEPSHYRLLDTSTFDAAIRDAAWLDRAAANEGAAIALGPFAVAFVDLPGAPG
ncbi:hypothetical protein [Bauldia sp.]|uniref:hypothetical protein n=1 Tax=Bauldia sp. TaxID=2575872 RepID=UPI003BABACDB